MNKRSLARSISLWVLTALVLAALACNMPGRRSEETPTPTMTLPGISALTATATLPEGVVPAVTETPDTGQPTPTLPPGVTPTPTTCTYNYSYVADVTIPDGSQVVAGAAFDKTWRVRNNGCLAWNGVQLVFDSGERMGGPASVAVPATSPGATVDLTVRLTAPGEAGEHRGYWRLQTPDGSVIGPYNLFVDITVVPPDTPTPTATSTTYPDLVVDRVYTTPEKPIIDTETTFHVIVKNTGAAPAGASKLLATFQPSGAARVVNVPELGTGATFDAQVKITYTAPGTYAAAFEVDTERQVAESNEGNNIYTNTFTHYRFVTYSTAIVTLPGTSCVDLDTGNIGCDGNADIWWEQVTAVERYLTPQNGAKAGVAGTTSVGYLGCSTLALSTARINGSDDASNKIPVGTYVCVLTDAGRYSQFRVNTYGYDLEIGYTTWALSDS